MKQDLSNINCLESLISIFAKNGIDKKTFEKHLNKQNKIFIQTIGDVVLNNLSDKDVNLIKDIESTNNVTIMEAILRHLTSGGNHSDLEKIIETEQKNFWENLTTSLLREITDIEKRDSAINEIEALLRLVNPNS